jgi:hypothetical protein
LIAVFFTDSTFDQDHQDRNEGELNENDDQNAQSCQKISWKGVHILSYNKGTMSIMMALWERLPREKMEKVAL